MSVVAEVAVVPVVAVVAVVAVVVVVAAVSVVAVVVVVAAVAVVDVVVVVAAVAVSCNSVQSTLRLQCWTYGQRAEIVVLKLALISKF